MHNLAVGKESLNFRDRSLFCKMSKKANKVSAWTSEHTKRLDAILSELQDGVDGRKVTGKQIKSHDPLFALLDSALFGRKIRQRRTERQENGLASIIFFGKQSN